MIGCDYAEDQRIGDAALKFMADHYRRLRNTFRYLLGALEGWSEAERIDARQMPELERWVLHRLSQLDEKVRATADSFDLHDLYMELHNFCAVDLSAFYFDIRKDSLYCDAPGNTRRRAVRTVLHEILSRLTVLARAGAGLHRGRSVARTALGRGRGQRASAHPSRRRLPIGATTRWPPSGTRCARSGASSPARWSWRGPTRRSAPACRRIRWCT